jgi:ribosomal protein S6--L-glutamate ligase
MKIYFMLAFARSGDSEANPTLVETFDILRARGVELEIGVANELVLDPTSMRAEHNLYVLKSHTQLWMSIAGILHGANARMLNPYLSCVAVQNKIVVERRLRAARIPIPHAWVTGNLGLLREIVAERPLFVKPYIGGRGAGVRLVRSPEELDALGIPEQPMLIQEYVPGDELKVYVIGREVFAIRKTPTDGAPDRTLLDVGEDVERIALRCGKVFALGLYGLDVLLGPEGPVVIDLNYFPSYKGVPYAADRLAEYIYGYACGDIAELAPSTSDSMAAAVGEAAASVWAMRWP